MTVAEVRRRGCVRCHRRAEAVWQACADENRERPICGRCDLELNVLVLRWMRDPRWKQKVQRYARVISGRRSGATTHRPRDMATA